MGCGRDHTLFAKISGKVRFYKKGPKNKTLIGIIPDESVVH